jgi:hypothetical protein
MTLYKDEAEGYCLNVDSPTPCWFIMWRTEEIDGQEVAVPKQVTLSYNEAARLMDAGERVDTLPASADIVEYLTAFVQEHYRPEPKKKRRKPSFEGGAGVEQMHLVHGLRRSMPGVGPDGQPPTRRNCALWKKIACNAACVKRPARKSRLP